MKKNNIKKSNMNEQIVKYWNDVHKKYTSRYDDWLNKYLKYIEKDNKILEIGCGRAYSSIYLYNEGYKNITASDISETALNKIKEENEHLNTQILNISGKYPYKDNEIDIIIADLSLHYFNKLETKKIVNEIFRVLSKNGYLIIRVNSTSDLLHIPENTKEIENNYYYDGTIYKKFFTKEELEELFSNYKIIELDEYTMTRYEKEKKVFEVCIQNKN